MNNLLRVLTESQVQLQTPQPEFKLLLNAVKEARRQNNDTKQSDAFYDSLEGLLQDLRTVTMDNHDAEAFLKPVTKSEVPDYFDFISQPMDLQTMLKKVKQKQYKSKREFEDDLDLIWTNCFTYNSTENHPLRQCAIRLKAKADKLLKNITDRKERADPTIPDLHSRGSTPRVNGVNGHGVGRARPVAFTKSPTPSKPHAAANGKHHRRESPPSQVPTFERTPEGMAAFLRLDRELDVRLREDAMANGVPGPSLEEQLLEYSPPLSDEDGDASHEGGLGEKRKLNGHGDHRPRKRTKMGHSDPVELWWDAMQSNAMIANGVPILRYSRSDEPPEASSSQSASDPSRSSGTRPRKKRRKALSSGPRKDTMLYHMNNNITTLRKVRNTHARLTALKESEDASGAGGALQQIMQPAAVDEPESLLDDRPWRVKGSGLDIGETNADDCIHWMGSKVLEHAGFQGASKTALDVLAGVASDYILNVGRTIRYLCDKYSNKMTAEEIVLHTLFESGVTRINELERYIKDDVVRYGGRLSELEKKLTSAYEEATVGEAWDDDALFRMEDEEEDSEFVMGNFADSYGEDFFGLRELGIADELGLSTLTVPKKLLRGKKGGPKLQENIEPAEPPPPFPPPPPFVQLDSNVIEDQIGLLKPYYHQRVSALAAGTASQPPLQPAAMLTNSPNMPPAPFAFQTLFGMPSQPPPTITVSVHPPTGPPTTSELPPMPFTAPTPFGQPTLPPPPPHHIAQQIVIPEDAPSAMRTKFGPLGQVLKSAPATANAAKKKSAPKPKTAMPGLKDPPDGDAGAAPDTPMTTAGTPTATAVETPKKNKGAGGGTGKKKKATNDGVPTMIMSF